MFSDVLSDVRVCPRWCISGAECSARYRYVMWRRVRVRVRVRVRKGVEIPEDPGSRNPWYLSSTHRIGDHRPSCYSFFAVLKDWFLCF